MSNKVRWSTLGLILTAALFCYFLGFYASSGLLIAAGVVIEGIFWFKFISSDKAKALL